MGFSVGDKIVHPRLGAGRITELKRQESINGVEDYYVIEIPAKELTTYIPVAKTEELGMRPVMSRAKLARVMETLRSKSDILPEDYKERQEQISEKIETGQPIQIAEVVRDLSWQQYTGNLTKRDSDLLARGRELLVGEMALVIDSAVSEVKKTLDETLAEAMTDAKS
jgi:CarD family transcriptional regulator